jgi:hypothetical protein
MPDPEDSHLADIVSLSREQYASNRVDVEDEIRSRHSDGADVGSRAVAATVNAQSPAGSTAPAGSHSASQEQIPNSPRSEFLAALRNPELPANGHASMQDHGGSRGQGSEHRPATHDSRTGDRPAQAQAAKPIDRTRNDEAVRAAILSVQAKLKHQR